MAVRDTDHLDTSLLATGASVFTALSGTANVVMQLSRPEIGYGVKDSVVAEGSLFGNPRRRQRTTAGLLAVAVLGTPEERALYRAATNTSHARVPNAFDPELQRWVAACIYRGFEEAREYTYGPLVGTEREEFYRQGMVFGAVLQMPPELWPAGRDAFEEYWTASLAAVRIDDAVREYLLRVIRLEYLHRSVPAPVVRLRFWLVTGYLPADLRVQLGLTWTPRQQRRFVRFNRAVGFVVRRLPDRVRPWPFTRSIRHIRERIAAGEHVFGS